MSEGEDCSDGFSDVETEPEYFKHYCRMCHELLGECNWEPTGEEMCNECQKEVEQAHNTIDHYEGRYGR